LTVTALSLRSCLPLSQKNATGGVAASVRRWLRPRIDWGHEHGLHKLTLSVFPHNEAPIALYRKFGFEEEGYARSRCAERAAKLWDLIEMGLLL
jgi:RimJ/RimL family protein N-acetyltransferase